MYYLNGRVLKPGRAFTHNGFQYPADWLKKSTAQQKAEIGVTFKQTRPSNIPVKTLEEELESRLKSENKTCYNLLQPTDWYLVRKYERRKAVPEEIKEFRSEVLKTYAAREKLLKKAESVEELQSIELPPWPNK